MKKILLLVSFLRSSSKTIEDAMLLAKFEKAELILFFVLDMEYADNIANTLTSEGWIGAKPSEQLYRSLLKEYKIQAQDKIDHIQKTAQELNIPVKSVIKSGSVLEETLKITAEEKPDLIVITRRKRSKLSRLIFGSMVGALKKQVSCPVKIIDAE